MDRSSSSFGERWPTPAGSRARQKRAQKRRLRTQASDSCSRSWDGHLLHRLDREPSMTASLLLPTTLLPTNAEAWRAVSARDAGHDGRFVYAVRSTRVYCRPSCPSRRPTRGNVRYFLVPEDAESAGYRACLRCRPREERALLDSERAVARARAYLDQHAGDTIPLTKLAAHAGASPFHLQRSFKRLLGVSPKQYQSALRASRFKARLRAGDTVSRATYEAGYGSSSRVYEHAHGLLGMSPAA